MMQQPAKSTERNCWLKTLLRIAGEVGIAIAALGAAAAAWVINDEALTPARIMVSATSAFFLDTTIRGVIRGWRRSKKRRRVTQRRDIRQCARRGTPSRQLHHRTHPDRGAARTTSSNGAASVT